jgi:diketogulonate reductase-like aldo/keto reductase
MAQREIQLRSVKGRENEGEANESSAGESSGGARVAMPTLAFGTAFGDWVGNIDFQGFLPEQAWRAVTLALDNGYRAFDCAHACGTEKIVGALLGQRFASGELGREDVFITTKLAHPAAPPHVNISHRRTCPDPATIA